jgi:hypothetical protein
MRHVFTLFDYSHHPPKPIQSISIDGNNIEFFTFYLPGTGKKIKEIKKEMARLANLFQDKVVVNDFKAHVAAFGLERHTCYSVYDLGLPPINHNPTSEVDGKKFLARLAKGSMVEKPWPWQRLLANVSVVYQEIEDNGVMLGYKRMYPRYSLDTFSGRSKTKGFNIQGTTENDNIAPVSGKPYFVHFDWIAADIRMASFFSDDQILEEAFRKSDPYAIVADFLGDPEFTRDRCKKELMRSIYSMNVSDPIMDVFLDLRDWMTNRIQQMRTHGFLRSILGRKFELGNELSVFNSQMQGSVVHAMQAVLLELYDEVSADSIVAEVHDSIVLCCDEISLKHIIKRVSEIMLSPLAKWGVDIRMPVRVSVGMEWKRWKTLRIYR